MTIRGFSPWRSRLSNTRCIRWILVSAGTSLLTALVVGNALFGQEAQGYVLVPTVLGGAHEWMAHLTQLALVWIAVLAMTSLVFRFGWDRAHAIAGALLLVAIAPFSSLGQQRDA